MRSLGIRHVLYGGPGYWAVQGVATCGLSGLCGLTDDACAGLDRTEGEYGTPSSSANDTTRQETGDLWEETALEGGMT